VRAPTSSMIEAAGVSSDPSEVQPAMSNVTSPMHSYSEEIDLSIVVEQNSASEVSMQSLSITEQPNTQDASQSTILSSATSESQIIKYKNGEVSFLVPGIPSLVSTERKCCVCGQKGRKRIPFCAILDAFVKRRIHIPPNNRSCSDHLENGRFTDAALLQIVPQKKDSYMTGKDVAKWMNLMANHCIRCQRTLDFGGDMKYEDEVYKMMLGVRKEDFETLHSFCSGKLRNSRNR